ncbi:hypothetical protein F2P56_023302, partial [Juglans regia]
MRIFQVLSLTKYTLECLEGLVPDSPEKQIKIKTLAFSLSSFDSLQLSPPPSLFSLDPHSSCLHAAATSPRRRPNVTVHLHYHRPTQPSPSLALSLSPADLPLSSLSDSQCRVVRSYPPATPPTPPLKLSLSLTVDLLSPSRISLKLLYPLCAAFLHGKAPQELQPIVFQNLEISQTEACVIMAKDRPNWEGLLKWRGSSSLSVRGKDKLQRKLPREKHNLQNSWAVMLLEVLEVKKM